MSQLNRRQFINLPLAIGASAWLPVAKGTQQGFWQTGAALPIKTQELYTAVHQNRLFVAGGIASKLGVPYFTDACYSYHPNSDAWRKEPDLPEPMHHAALVSNGERLFLVGGFNGGFSHIWRMRGDVYELDNNKWRKIGSLPRPQAEGVLSTAPNGVIHLVTGQSQRGDANTKRSDHVEVTTHLSWQPGDSSWTEQPAIPTARNSATGAWVGDQLIVTGGRTAAGNLAVTEIFDLSSASWRTAAPLPLPQAGTASVVVDDGIIVFGGEIFTPTSKVFKEVWRYHLNEDKWSALPAMRTPRHGIGAGRFGNQVFVVGGATEPGGKGTSNLNEVLDLKHL